MDFAFTEFAYEMFFCPTSMQDTKALIITINRSCIYSIQMLADG